LGRRQAKRGGEWINNGEENWGTKRTFARMKIYERLKKNEEEKRIPRKEKKKR